MDKLQDPEAAETVQTTNVPAVDLPRLVVRCRRTRKQVRADRLWRHWLSWMGEPYGPDLKRIEGYQPEKYRSSFERFQTHGRKGLSQNELYGIHPLLAAQKAKEVTLTSMAEESMEWWAKGNGWAIPWHDTLERVKSGENMDRLTRAAILRTMKSIAKDPHDFFERHPGISAELKQRYFSQAASGRVHPLVRLACDDWRCGWRGDSATVLRAPAPFNEGCELTACPKCREQTIRACCDEPDCWEQDTCGTPTPNGYRRTCGRHQPNDPAHTQKGRERGPNNTQD